MDRKWTEGPWTKATAEDIEGALITDCFMHHRSIFVGYTLQASRLYASALALYEALDAAVICLRNRDQNEREAAVVAAGIAALRLAHPDTTPDTGE